MKRIKLASNNFLYQLGGAALQFSIILIIARSIDIQQHGVYVLVMLVSRTLANLFVAGVNVSSIYFVNNNGINFKDIFFLNIKFSMTISVVVVTCSLLISNNFHVLLFPEVPLNILIIGIVLFVFILFNLLMFSLFQAISRFDLYNKFFLGNSALQFLLVLLVVLFDTATAQNFVYAILVSSFFFSVLSCYRLFFIAKTVAVSGSKCSQCKIGQFYCFGLKSHLSNVVAFLMSRLDVFMLGFFISPVAAAIYSVAILFVERVGMVSQSLITVIFPELVENKASKLEIYSIISEAFRLNLILTLIFSLLSVLLIYPAIKYLFGVDYLSAVVVFYILLVGVIFKSCSRVIAISITAMGKPEINFYTAIFVLCLNASLNYLLIPQYGINGAALATTVSYTANLLLRLLIFRSKIFLFPVADLMPRSMDLTKLMK